MTGLARLVADARDAGVEIAVEGDNLLLTAPVEPPRSIVDLLARHKAELIALLQPGPGEWTVEDWRAYFDERAGIIEYDGGASRSEAEARALDCCISEWLRRTPIRGATDRCLGCGGAERREDTVRLVFGRNPAGAWLHSRCWPAWNASRNAEARSALIAIGVEPLANFKGDFRSIGGK